uniref:HTH cro/C1-type domain-containing protein n=1 Tax=Amphiprion ocellaris TaxID=80972 RepID=A0A3Q1D2I3_AMPOC
MNTRRHLTDVQRHLAIARLQVGRSQSDVARELGVSQSVISRLAARHRTTGSVGDRPRSGAPQVMDRNDDQYLRTYALRHRYATATQLQACLREVRGTRVSRQTIRNRLHRFGLNARRPLQVTPLTPRHRCDRLQWAQDHVTWTMQQWSTKHLLLTLSVLVIWGYLCYCLNCWGNKCCTNENGASFHSLIVISKGTMTYFIKIQTK